MRCGGEGASECLSRALRRDLTLLTPTGCRRPIRLVQFPGPELMPMALIRRSGSGVTQAYHGAVNHYGRTIS